MSISENRFNLPEPVGPLSGPQPPPSTQETTSAEAALPAKGTASSRLRQKPPLTSDETKVQSSKGKATAKAAAGGGKWIRGTQKTLPQKTVATAAAHRLSPPPLPLRPDEYLFDGVKKGDLNQVAHALEDKDLSSEELSKAFADAKGKPGIQELISKRQYGSLISTLKEAGVEQKRPLPPGPAATASKPVPSYPPPPAPTGKAHVQQPIPDDLPPPPSTLAQRPVVPSDMGETMTLPPLPKRFAANEPGVKMEIIQGGEDTAPQSSGALKEKVDSLKGCKTDSQRVFVLSTLKAGERKQVEQFVKAELMMVGQNLSGARGSTKESLLQEKMTLLTLASQLAVLDAIPASSIEKHPDSQNLSVKDTIAYISDPYLLGSAKNETFVDYRDRGISNETLMNRFALAYSGFTTTKDVVTAILKRYVEVIDNPSAQQNLLQLLSKVHTLSSQSSNESAEAKKEINERLQEFTQTELKKPGTKSSLQMQLQLVANQVDQPIVAVDLGKKPVKPETGLRLQQVLAPGKKSPEMIANFASSLTSIQNRAYQSINPSEFFTTVGSIKSNNQPNLTESIRLFNNITNAAVQAILQENSSDRSGMIKFFIDVQNELIKNGDFQSAFAIQAAFNNAAIDRLDEKKELSGRYGEALEKSSKLFDPGKNFANLTAEIKQRKATGEFYLPLMSLALGQLTNANEMANSQDKAEISPFKVLKFGEIIETAFESQSEKNKNIKPPEYNVRSDLLNLQVDIDEMYDKSLILQPRK